MIDRRVDPALRASVRAELEKTYKRDVIMPVGLVPAQRRLPSRSLALDYIMGGEGYPFGCMTRLWGGWSTGKSTAIFNAFWSAQNYGDQRAARLEYLAPIAKMSGEPKEAKRMLEEAKRVRGNKLTCFYVCTEKIFDRDLPESLGVSLDQEHFEIAFTRRIEEIGQIVQKALGAYNVVAVDSTTGTMSLDELATDKGEQKGVEDASNTVGMTRARKWGYNMDWWQDRIGPENILIFTSQIQAKMGQRTMAQAQMEQSPGGEKLNHEPGIILHFMNGSRLKRKPDGALVAYDSKGADSGAFGRAESAGREVVVRCDKNKYGRSERTSLHHYDRIAMCWDPIHEYEKLAKYLRVVERSSEKSSWYVLPDGARTQSLRQAIIGDPLLRRQIEDRVYRCASDPAYENEILRDGPGEPMLQLVESA